MTTCTLPPPGWWCSREPGHDGPCAARENHDVVFNMERTFSRFKYAEEFAHGLHGAGLYFRLTNRFDVVHIEPGEEDEPYMRDEFVVEWRD